MTKATNEDREQDQEQVHAVKIPLPYDQPSWSDTASLLIEMCQSTSLAHAFSCLEKIYKASDPTTQLDLGETLDVETRNPCGGLWLFFDTLATQEEKRSFVTESLPAIAHCALYAEDWQPENGLYYCAAQTPASITLDRRFVASLVALGFLCLLPDKFANSTRLNFATFLDPQYYTSGIPAQCSKLRFILNYFRRIHRMQYQVPGYITYRRIVLRSPLHKQALSDSTTPLCPVTVDTKRRLEESGCHTLQIDFANQHIGGGVLGGGKVQEEIRFCVCPELLASLLFMECMQENEAIVIQGFEQFSDYANYGRELQFAYNLEDDSLRDNKGDILTTLSAIDAMRYSRGAAEQYRWTNVCRDINKAYIGFLQPYLDAQYSELQLVNQRVANWKPAKVEINERVTPPDHAQSEQATGSEINIAVTREKRAIATGNWGCGAFGGNAQLKCMLQWISASEAGCPQMIYYTFKDPEMKGLEKVVQCVMDNNWTVRQLFSNIDQFCARKCEGMEDNFFKFVLPEDLRSHVI